MISWSSLYMQSKYTSLWQKGMGGPGPLLNLYISGDTSSCPAPVPIKGPCLAPIQCCSLAPETRALPSKSLRVSADTVNLLPSQEVKCLDGPDPSRRESKM